MCFCNSFQKVLIEKISLSRAVTREGLCGLLPSQMFAQALSLAWDAPFLDPWGYRSLPRCPSWGDCPDPCPPETSTHQHSLHSLARASPSQCLFLSLRFLTFPRADALDLNGARPVAGGHMDGLIPHTATSTATHRPQESRSCVPPIGVGIVRTVSYKVALAIYLSEN